MIEQDLEAGIGLLTGAGYHIGVVRGIILGVSEVFESVSPQFHVGIHPINGKQGIFPVGEDGSVSINL